MLANDHINLLHTVHTLKSCKRTRRQVHPGLQESSLVADKFSPPTQSEHCCIQKLDLHHSVVGDDDKVRIVRRINLFPTLQDVDFGEFGKVSRVHALVAYIPSTVHVKRLSDGCEVHLSPEVPVSFANDIKHNVILEQFTFNDRTEELLRVAAVKDLIQYLWLLNHNGRRILHHIETNAMPDLLWLLILVLPSSSADSVFHLLREEPEIFEH